jgi:hypothetical protein
MDSESKELESIKAYKYLGVEESRNIERKNEKEMLKKAYVRNLRFILNTELWEGNKTATIRTQAAPVLRHGFRFINWHQEEI